MSENPHRVEMQACFEQTQKKARHQEIKLGELMIL